MTSNVKDLIKKAVTLMTIDELENHEMVLTTEKDYIINTGDFVAQLQAIIIVREEISLRYWREAHPETLNEALKDEGFKQMMDEQVTRD